MPSTPPNINPAAHVHALMTSASGAAACDAIGAVTEGGLGDLATLNAAPAGTLTGSTLASNVTASSLTSTGTLTSLGVAGASTLNNTSWGNSAAFSYGNTTASANHLTALGVTPRAPLGLTQKASIIFVAEGDSLTSASGSTGATGNWPYHLINDYPLLSGATLVNVAVSGETAAAMVGQYTAQVHPYAPTNGQLGFFSLLAGTNDIAGSTAATVYANLATEWAAARADGFKVIAFTVPVNTGWASVANATEIKRKALNNLIRQHPELYDYLIDLDLVWNVPGAIDNVTGTSYFSDGIHFTELGNRIIAQMVYDTVFGDRRAYGISETVQKAIAAGYFQPGPALDFFPAYDQHPGMWTTQGGFVTESTAGYQGTQFTANLIRSYGSNWQLRNSSRPGWRAALLADSIGDHFALGRIPSGSSTETTHFRVKANGNVLADTGDVVTATTAKGFRVGGESGPLWRSGTGTPEGAVTAPVGSLFSRTDGGANTTFYVKESGTGNTGWIAK